MKLEILSSVLFFAVFVQCKPLSSVNLGQISDNCSDQTGMDKQTLKDIISNGNIPPPNPTYFHFLECLYKKQNYLDDQGNVSYSNIESFLSSFYETDTLRKAMKPCKNIQIGSSSGEKAYNAGTCLIRSLQIVEAEAEGEDHDLSEESINTV